MERENNIRVHRVGSVTTGLCMIGFGLMFLMHLLWDTLSYDLIFSLWPLMLVGLGIELLLSCFSTRKIVYDKAAIVLLLLMTLLAMGMAVADVCMETSKMYWEMNQL